MVAFVDEATLKLHDRSPSDEQQGLVNGWKAIIAPLDDTNLDPRLKSRVWKQLLP
jgi:hypothetical protein